MKSAVERIIKGYSKNLIDYMMINAQKVLDNERVEIIRFEKMSFFRKFKL